MNKYLKRLLKYENKDKSCSYPFHPSLAGYCWSYANHVDGDPRFKNLKELCNGCEFYKKPKALAQLREKKG